MDEATSLVAAGDGEAVGTRALGGAGDALAAAGRAVVAAGTGDPAGDVVGAGRGMRGARPVGTIIVGVAAGALVVGLPVVRVGVVGAWL